MLGMRARKQYRPSVPDRSLCITVLCGSSMLSLNSKQSMASGVQQAGSFSPWSETKFQSPQWSNASHDFSSPDSTATRIINDDMCALRKHIDSLTHQKDEVIENKDRLEHQVIQLLTEKKMNDEYMALLTKSKNETDAKLKHLETDSNEIIMENYQLKEQIVGLENNVKQLSCHLAARDNLSPRHDAITTLHEAASNLYRGHMKRNSMSSDEFDRILAKLSIYDLNRTESGTSNNLSTIRSSWNLQLKLDLEKTMSKLTPIRSPLHVIKSTNTTPLSEDKSTNTEPTICIDLFSGCSSSTEDDSDWTTEDQWTTDLVAEKKAAIDAWETVIRRDKADSPTNSRESVMSDLTPDLYASIEYPDMHQKEVQVSTTENEALLETETVKCKTLFLCPIMRHPFAGKKTRYPSKGAKVPRTTQTKGSF